jgi:predicted RNase H-like HicB family nuclease
MRRIDFDAIVFREGPTFVAYCPELDVSSCGKDVDEARQNLRTAARVFLEEAERMGTLEQILEEGGYVLDASGAYTPPTIVLSESMEVQVGS